VAGSFGVKCSKTFNSTLPSFARIQIPHVFAGPAECFPRHDLQPGEIDLT
jgi:hypothetical protein